MRALFLAAALLAATPAFAQTPASSATLKAPASTARTIIDGATWRCEGDACVATGGANQPAARACRRVASRLGPVAAFTYKGVSLTEEQIAACNG